MMSFGDNLKKWRKLRGYSRQEMATKLNMTVSAYGFYENDRTKPDISKLMLIADILQASPNELLGFRADEFTDCKHFWEASGYRLNETLYGGVEIFFHPSLEKIIVNGNELAVKKYSVLLLRDKDEFIAFTRYAESKINTELARVREKVFDGITLELKDALMPMIETRDGVRHYYGRNTTNFSMK